MVESGETKKNEIQDGFGEVLHTGNLVMFLRGRLLIIGKIISMTGYKITIQDEQDKTKTYTVNSHILSMAE